MRLGIIGTGLRGQNHLWNALQRQDVDVIAICDVDEVSLQSARDLVTKSGRPMPKIFTGDPHAYQKIAGRKRSAGYPDCHTLGMAYTHDPGWYFSRYQIHRNRSGAGYHFAGSLECRACSGYPHGAHVMMMENVCYRRDIMAILQMVRQGLFGELIHMQAGYQHDLRGVKFNDGKTPYDSGVEFGEKAFSEARWRTNHSVHRNGDLYPTHGIGPVAEMLNINYGNRFVSLSSFASKSRGLHEYIVKKGGPQHPNAKVEFKLGDVVTTQIRCANGETILLQHDTSLPRPYSLGFRVQGTHGIWMDINHSLYIEGISSKPDVWESAQPYLDKYDHPDWQRWGKEAENAGHGGMDFFVLQAFIESVKQQTPTPMDVYDAAAWSSITPLSEMSIELGNQTVEMPDFTSGQWMNRVNRF